MSNCTFLITLTESNEASSHSDPTTSSINTVAANAAEAVAKGHTSVSFILPKLYQRFPSEWIKVGGKFKYLYTTFALFFTHLYGF